MIRASQPNRDSGKCILPQRRPSGGGRLWPNSHRLLQAVHFGSSDPNSSLSARSALQIVDRHGLASDHEPTMVGLAQPVVESCSTDSKSVGGFLHGEQSIAYLSCDHAPNLGTPEAHDGRTVRTALVLLAGRLWSRQPATTFGNGRPTRYSDRFGRSRIAPFQLPGGSDARSARKRHSTLGRNSP